MIELLKINGKNIVDDYGKPIILRGFNTISYDIHEKDGGYPLIQDDYYRVAGAGFNIMRIETLWAFDEYEGGGYNETANGLPKIDEAVNKCANAGLKAQICCHLSSYYWTDYDSLYLDPNMADRFVNFWRMLANRYRDNPTVIGFQPLLDAWHPPPGGGEPPLGAQSQYHTLLMPRLINAIREESNKIIFVKAWNAQTFFKQADPNIVYLHDHYQPTDVTFAGAEYNPSGNDYQTMINLFQAGLTFQNTYNVPIMINAFGIRVDPYGWSPSRLQWIEDVCKAMDDFQYHWFYWLYTYHGRPKGDFGVMNLDGTPTPVFDVLMKYASIPTPTRYVFDHWEVNGANVGSANPVKIGPITADVRIVSMYKVAPPTPAPNPLGLLVLTALILYLAIR